MVRFAVNGTLMRGLELNPNLLAVGARFLFETTSAPVYRLWSINDAYPAMQRDVHAGAAITIEVWEISATALIDILENEPPGLCLGYVTLADNSKVLGILGELWVCRGQTEITGFGGWLEYLSQKQIHN